MGREEKQPPNHATAGPLLFPPIPPSLGWGEAVVVNMQTRQTNGEGGCNSPRGTQSASGGPPPHPKAPEGRGLFWHEAQLWKGAPLPTPTGPSRWGEQEPPHLSSGPAQNSTLQAGKVSSCMATVLLLPRTVTPSSCRRSSVSMYHSCMTSESKVGMRVT